MELLIFGNLTENEKNAVCSGMSSQEYQKYDLMSLDKSKFLAEIKGLDLNSILVFDKLEYNFVSVELFSLLRDFLNEKLNLPEIKVILIEDYQSDGRNVITWTKSLFQDFKLNINVVAEIDAVAFASEVKQVLNLICSKQNLASSEQKDNNVTIYTDGACSGNPGAGGWGAVLIHGNHKKEISGYDPMTTNNQMELTAVIKALELLKTNCNVELFSDSAYVVNSINQKWLSNWKSNNWVGADKKQVKNIELWKRLDNLLSIHNVHFNKVKGHSDNELNNRCDELATGEISKHIIDEK